ncbi:ABC transporter ATP-binding protein [Gimesia sp.]|uniref:ABC transporter ATP-binding protein n=1 Tax=Gimesia sp. TaxID=2024833 RepID=UPI000C69E4F5|nr:ABC transporter ATP-binding protein [Gimesia sp.]MAX38950.1 ferrichrome ABC transporter ATP-binding protein [Gimesia sp.]HAH45413.1 ABC transporter ATP-binding protein [Planctomycetaceae bacterium]HBL45805.1 ABC transporter ATP-binding protein [Planctomycetaceae bacterium]
MILEASDISFSYGSHQVLEDVNLQLKPGMTAIIGPNAAGKSTLLKCLSGMLRPKGKVRLEGITLTTLKQEQLTRQISFLPQEFNTTAVLTVYETVLLGRVHQLGWRVSDVDTRIVNQLMQEMKLTDIADRYLNELSGGQRQLVAIAQSLAREPSVLLLDEPTSNLDLRRQYEVCTLIRRLTDSRGISTALAVHDLNLASRYADWVYVIQNGKLRCGGEPQSVLTETLIAEVYGVEARVTIGQETRPVITVLGPVPVASSDFQSERDAGNDV